MLPRFTRKPADHPLGYVVALSGLLMQLMSYGIDNSYSIFSQDMHADASLGYPSVTAISLGNSISLGLSPVFGVFAGFCVDRLPPRVMMAVSTLLLFGGLWISSGLATNIYAVTFTYCLFASIGTACMLSPGAAATSSWFKRRQGLAMGINFAGGGIGSAIIPPLAGKWVVEYGWRRAFQLMSAFCAIGVLATALSARRREPDDGNDNDGDAEQLSGDTEPMHGLERSAQRSMEARKEAEGDDAAEETSAPEKELEHGQSDEVGAAQEKQKDLKCSATDARSASIATVDTELKAVDRSDEINSARSLHNDRLAPWELFVSMFTRPFAGNFLCWFVYSWSFFSIIYIAVPYVSSMGKPGTVYENVAPIPVNVAATLFTFYGVFQVVGSVAVGWIATLVSPELVYMSCSTIGGIGCGLLAFGRSYVVFALLLCIIGFCMAGMFAVMPTLIASHLYGPNLGFYFGSVFLAGVVGGMGAPPLQAMLQQRHNGNYSYGCAVMSGGMTLSAVICYVALWQSKKCGITVAARRTKLQETM
uniref:Putative transporter n=1 Tax=Trypanosoma congolense (strain IL3000) TaxID=1068625 RepID=G0UMB9_TRYCI|nr:putative transporter [Trypanosoma congolense IL3000]